MRTIKFRAWDVFYNKFVYSGDEEGALSNFFAKVAGDEAAGREVPVQQFTELLDKNGREIYEGDILSLHDGLKWVVRDVRDNHQLEELKRVHAEETFEVIGNIYENKDLLV